MRLPPLVLQMLPEKKSAARLSETFSKLSRRFAEKSPPDGSAMAFNKIAASKTLLVIGPTWSSDSDSGTTPLALTRPNCGFKPTTPHCDAGSRIEPAVSVPIAANPSPAATAVAEPPEEPPAMCSRFHALWTSPKQLIIELPPYANSCRFCLPSITAPARFRRVTTSAS